MAKNATKLAADIETPDAPIVPLTPLAETPVRPNVEITFATYLEKAFIHGGEKAVGDDSLAALAIDIADGGKKGKIDPRTKTELEKAGLTGDDAIPDVEKLFAAYVKGKKAKAIHDRSDVATKAGQLRNFVKLGKLTDIDGPAVLDDVVASYKAATEDLSKEERKKYNDAFTSYLEFAKKQVASPKAIVSPDVVASCFKKTAPKRSPSVAAQWKKLSDAAQKLTDGTFKLPDGTVICDTTPEGIAMAATLKVFATDVVAAAAIQAKLDDAAKLQLELDQRKAEKLETA